MHAGLPKYVPVNLKDIEAAGFEEGEEAISNCAEVTKRD